MVYKSISGLSLAGASTLLYVYLLELKEQPQSADLCQDHHKHKYEFWPANGFHGKHE